MLNYSNSEYYLLFQISFWAACQVSHVAVQSLYCCKRAVQDLYVCTLLTLDKFDPDQSPLTLLVSPQTFSSFVSVLNSTHLRLDWLDLPVLSAISISYCCGLFSCEVKFPASFSYSIWLSSHSNLYLVDWQVDQLTLDCGFGAARDDWYGQRPSCITSFGIDQVCLVKNFQSEMVKVLNFSFNLDDSKILFLVDNLFWSGRRDTILSVALGITLFD